MSLTAEQLIWLRNASANEIETLALQMIARHPASFAKFVQEVAPVTFHVQYHDSFGSAGNVSATFTPSQMQELRGFNGSDNKISCIKAIRTMTGLGLKEAKELSEHQPFITMIGARWDATNG